MYKYQFASFPLTGTAIFYLVNTCRYNWQGLLEGLVISLAIKTANNKSQYLNSCLGFLLCFLFCFYFTETVSGHEKILPKSSKSSGLLGCSVQKNQVTTNVFFLIQLSIVRSGSWKRSCIEKKVKIGEVDKYSLWFRAGEINVTLASMGSFNRSCTCPQRYDTSGNWASWK